MPFDLCREICGKKALVVVGVVTCTLPGAFILWQMLICTLTKYTNIVLKVVYSIQ